MKIFSLNGRIWLGFWSLCLMAGTHGQTLPGATAQKSQQTANSQQQRAASTIEDEYDLVSSSNSPLWHWKMIKGRLSVKRIDDRHLLISLACVWSDRLNVLCAEQWVAQWRDGNLYLQDMDTDNQGLYFDPTTRALAVTMIVDEKGTLQTNVFHPAGRAAGDKAMIRRAKKMQSGFASPELRKLYGHHSTWKYARARIEFRPSALPSTSQGKRAPVSAGHEAAA